MKLEDLSNEEGPDEEFDQQEEPEGVPGGNEFIDIIDQSLPIP